MEGIINTLQILHIQVMVEGMVVVANFPLILTAQVVVGVLVVILVMVVWDDRQFMEQAILDLEGVLEVTEEQELIML